jgi:UDP-3-O-[3-hydroxymyristoyl] glucosamine N-acyltransferase
MEFSAQQIADFLHGTVVGNTDAKVRVFSKIEEAQAGSLSFLANPKYENFIYTTHASIVLVNDDFQPSQPVEATMIRVPNAYMALAQLLNLVEKSKPRKSGVAKTASIATTTTVGNDCYIGDYAVVGENSKIGDGCLVYPHAVIGDNVTIGSATTIYPHVTVYDGCIIGAGCIIHAGAVIGADGFGFAPENGKYEKIAQIGNVVIEDNVEIGANTTIDRAVIGSTVISQGVKLDNLIQIAHNVEVGENTVMAAQTGVAGSTKIGANCMLGGQVGLGGHITIGDNTQIGAQSGIISNTPAGSRIMGSPAIPVKDFMRSSVIFRKLHDMYITINELKKK